MGAWVLASALYLVLFGMGGLWVGTSLATAVAFAGIETRDRKRSRAQVERITHLLDTGDAGRPGPSAEYRDD